jgi:hypothetical protein
VLKTRLGTIPKEVEQSINVVDVLKLVAVDKEMSMAPSHPLLSDLYNKIAAVKAVKSIQIPASLKKVISNDPNARPILIKYFWWLPNAPAAEGIIIGEDIKAKIIGRTVKVANIATPNATAEELAAERYNTDEAGYRVEQNTIEMNQHGWAPSGELKRIETTFTVSPILSLMMNAPFARQLAIYLFNRAQAAQAREEENHMFAMARLHVTLNKQYIDSTEVQIMKNVHIAYPNENLISVFHDSFSRPEIWQLLEHAIAISFLRSGHHATAYNMYNVLLRILGSLNQTVTNDFVQAYLRAYVYHGGHVGSTRVQILQSWAKASTNNFIGSIAYRLHPAPPMFATYTNLELYIDQLNLIGFFEYMNKQAEYTLFKSAMNAIKKKMHFAAPYSNYLYGRTEADPTAEKAIAIKVAAYATAIAAVMPNSSLLESPALQKLVTQTSDNTISANLLIEAYVTAYRSFHRRIVEQRLSQRVSGGGSLTPLQ